MLRNTLLFFIAGFMLSTATAAKVGVQLYDMYRTEMVYLMTSEEVRELKAELAEEKRVFNKAFSTIKRQWTKTQADAKKAGDKDYPKFPTRAFIWVRSAKFKNFSTDDAADKWFAKQKARIDEDMTAKAKAAQEAIKAAQGAATAGYKSRDDKKRRRHADKVEMDDAVKEKAGEMIEAEMSLLLQYNRPVPKHFIYDPVAGADKNIQKKMDEQDAVYEQYLKRKAEALNAPEEASAPASL